MEAGANFCSIMDHQTQTEALATQVKKNPILYPLCAALWIKPSISQQQQHSSTTNAAAGVV